MGFQAYASELQGHIPKIPYSLSEKLINRAWQKIRRERLWSFLIREAPLFFPSSLVAGTASVTYGSPTVTGDATAAAAWTAEVLGIPPLIQRQFRVGSAGPLYNITAIATVGNPNDTLTLDQNFGEDTNATANYSIYLAYVRAPQADFKRWKSIVDPNNGYGVKWGYRRESLDRRDPTRGSQGQPYLLADYKSLASTNAPMFEAWPHPTSQTTLQTMYEVRGEDFASDAEELPPVIPEDLLIDYALAYFGYPWANANVGRYPELKGTNWLALSVEAQRRAKESMVMVKRDDEEAVVQTISYFRGRYGWGPIDGRFEQSHSDWNLNA
jgi:hypothetical protein